MFLLISAFAQVGGVLLDKIVLTRRQVSQHVFVPAVFLLLFVLTLILFPFLGKVSPLIFTPYYLVIFALMILSAIVWNFFYYRGVQAEKVHEFELILMFQPLLTIVLAALFLKGEQNVHTMVAAIVAALALVAAHLNENHLQFSTGAKCLICATVFMSVELILIKILLNVLSPVALYTIRTAIIFVFFYLYYKPDLFKMSNTNTALILFSAFFGVSQMVTKFYGFEKYGVVYTSLILILSPLLVYIISTIFLHERLKLRTIISAVVILLCIVYATVLGK